MRQRLTHSVHSGGREVILTKELLTMHTDIHVPDRMCMSVHNCVQCEHCTLYELSVLANGSGDNHMWPFYHLSNVYKHPSIFYNRYILTIV